MATSEATTESFIVKLTVEEPAATEGEAAWRGRITHVASGKHRYFHNLNEIVEFIAPYLEAVGVRIGIEVRVRRWLKRRNS